jgi:hypothetical protein
MLKLRQCGWRSQAMQDLRKDWQRWTKAERFTAFPILFLIALTLGASIVLTPISTLSSSGHSAANIERAR